MATYLRSAWRLPQAVPSFCARIGTRALTGRRGNHRQFARNAQFLPDPNGGSSVELVRPDQLTAIYPDRSGNVAGGVATADDVVATVGDFFFRAARCQFGGGIRGAHGMATYLEAPGDTAGGTVLLRQIGTCALTGRPWQPPSVLPGIRNFCPIRMVALLSSRFTLINSPQFTLTDPGNVASGIATADDVVGTRRRFLFPG